MGLKEWRQGELYLDEQASEIQTISGSRIHRSRVLCHADGELLFDVVNDFIGVFSTEGSFARVIWRDTLSPEGRTEGVAFGDTFRRCHVEVNLRIWLGQ